MNYFGNEATDKFDAIVFGVPIKMKDEVRGHSKTTLIKFGPSLTMYSLLC